MAMKEHDDYRMREERELGERDRETNRHRDSSSRDWRDDESYRNHDYASDRNRMSSSNWGNQGYNSGSMGSSFGGNYNQGSSYRGANYGQGSTEGRGGPYGQDQSRGQRGPTYDRYSAQDYNHRDWTRDWQGPTDYRSSPYERDMGRSQWGSSEYGANFRDASSLGSERGQYGRYGTDFRTAGYGTNYGDRYSARDRGAYDYDTGMYMGHEPGWNRDDNSRSGSQFHGGHHETMMEKVGRFFGVGPKGYKRSDTRIEEEVNDALADDAFVDASNIEVKVKDAEVTLEGTCEDRMVKRRAEDLAANVRGVKDVHNHLRTLPLGSNTDIGTTSAASGLATSDKKTRTNAVS